MAKNGEKHPKFQVMALSAAAHYALEGMADLARRPGCDLRLAGEVARRRGLPASFLAKIFRRLAARGLLDAKRGPGGGYGLAKDPRAISIFEIISAVSEPPSGDRRCLLGTGFCGQRPCPAHETVVKAERMLRGSLERLSLAELAAGAAAALKRRTHR